jgi:hypothetical protein
MVIGVTLTFGHTLSVSNRLQCSTNVFFSASSFETQLRRETKNIAVHPHAVSTEHVIGLRGHNQNKRTDSAEFQEKGWSESFAAFEHIT